MGRHILIVVLLFFCLLGRANDYVITTPSEKVTLSDAYVNRIYKDSDGYIWLGTGSKVERFDQTGETVYRFEGNLTSYAPYLVNAIEERVQHEYWVGNVHGLFQLDHNNRTARRIFQDKINFPVLALRSDGKGNMYIGTANGLLVYKDGGLKTVTLNEKKSLSGNSRILAIEIVDDKAWLLTPGAVAVYDITSGAVKFYDNTLPDCGNFRCFTRVDNRLYIGTEQKGVATFDMRSFRFSPYWEGVRVPVSSLSHEDGLLAVGTIGKGVSIVSLNTGKTVYAAGCNTQANRGLLSDDISSVLFSNGNLWCGTIYYLGLNYLKNTNQPFRLYRCGDFTSKDLIVRSCFYHEGIMYIGTREGFYRMDEATGRVQHFSAGDAGCELLRSNLIFSFYAYDGNVLVGTCEGGLAVYSPATNRFVETPLTKALVRNDVFMYLEDDERNLWIAASDGLYCYVRATGEVKEYNSANSGMPGNIVYGICLDSAKRFWVGTDKGVALFDVKTGRCSQTGLPSDELRTERTRYIYEGRDGSLHFFLLTENRWTVADKDLNIIRSFDDFNVFNFAQDEEGNYWLGSEDGLMRMDESLTHYSLFPVDDLVGVLMSASAGASICKYRNGELLVPCMKGLVVVDTRSTFRHSPVQIDRMSVNGEPLAGSYQLRPDTTFALKGSENNLTFTFTSSGYENPALVKYQYRLLGKDSTWHWLRGESKVSFYNLSSGRYTFMVRKALTEDSVCSVTFTIAKNWSWIWFLFSGLIGAGGILAYLMVRKRNRANTLHDAPMTVGRAGQTITSTAGARIGQTVASTTANEIGETTTPTAADGLPIASTSEVGTGQPVASSAMVGTTDALEECADENSTTHAKANDKTKSEADAKSDANTKSEVYSKSELNAKSDGNAKSNTEANAKANNDKDEPLYADPEEPTSPEYSVKLSDDEAQKVIAALKAYMEKGKPYLNVDLKQSEVAQAIGSSAYILSAVFTHFLKMGYYDYVNSYRVEEFKQAVRRGDHQKFTIVTLSERCGFKSKTSFFRTFKKFTGTTPNEYINSLK